MKVSFQWTPKHSNATNIYHFKTQSLEVEQEPVFTKP